jgi:hypothetical protein
MAISPSPPRAMARQHDAGAPRMCPVVGDRIVGQRHAVLPIVDAGGRLLLIELRRQQSMPVEKNVQVAAEDVERGVQRPEPGSNRRAPLSRRAADGKAISISSATAACLIPIPWPPPSL